MPFWKFTLHLFHPHYVAATTSWGSTAAEPNVSPLHLLYQWGGIKALEMDWSGSVNVAAELEFKKGGDATQL